MSDYIITTYKENIKRAQSHLDNSVLNGFTDEDPVVSYSENFNSDFLGGAGGVADHSTAYYNSKDDEGYDDDDKNKNDAEDHHHHHHHDDDEEFVEEVLGMYSDELLQEDSHEDDGVDLPGAGRIVVVKEDEPKETDWENDRDPKHFMIYIADAYPGKIPQHDGTTTLGCERAIHFLRSLNSEISEAIKKDVNNALDLDKLEKMRNDILDGVGKLQSRVKDLNRSRNKTAGVSNDEILKQAEINKVASTPIIQLVVTPFERAISGILINATVSAGKPFEDVYEHLKEKYSLDEREELAIMQILRDMGHPIFKDRGTIGKPSKKDEKAQGVDFIKNYFA